MKNIILLHGALGAAEQLIKLQHLMSSVYKVYILEFEGHGLKAGNDVPFDIMTMSMELDEFIATKCIKDPIIFGYSMGGYVALYNASQNPTNIAGVITLATKFDWNLESAQKEASTLDPDLMEIQIPNFCETLHQRHGLYWKNVVLKTAQLMLQLGINSPINDKVLAKMKIPVLICLGDKDRMVRLQETTSIVSKIKSATLQILSDTSHPFERVDLQKIKELIATLVT